MVPHAYTQNLCPGVHPTLWEGPRGLQPGWTSCQAVARVLARHGEVSSREQGCALRQVPWASSSSSGNQKPSCLTHKVART